MSLTRDNVFVMADHLSALSSHCALRLIRTLKAIGGWVKIEDVSLSSNVPYGTSVDILDSLAQRQIIRQSCDTSGDTTYRFDSAAWAELGREFLAFGRGSTDTQ